MHTQKQACFPDSSLYICIVYVSACSLAWCGCLWLRTAQVRHKPGSLYISIVVVVVLVLVGTDYYIYTHIAEAAASTDRAILSLFSSPHFILLILSKPIYGRSICHSSLIENVQRTFMCLENFLNSAEYYLPVVEQNI